MNRALAAVIFGIALLAPTADALAMADSELQTLGRDFWAWRARRQPVTGDDIPRLERPDGWLPDWRAETVAQSRHALAAFEARWAALKDTGGPLPEQVDYQLVGSALARVRWELDVLAGWRRNPYFYVEQTLTAVFEELLPPPPFTTARCARIVGLFGSFGGTLEAARGNLSDMRRPFAAMTVAAIADPSISINAVVAGLLPVFCADLRAELEAAAKQGIAALAVYRDWLGENLDGLPQDTAIGREGYQFFLEKVALLPYSPERILAMGEQEWERSVAFETFEAGRNAGLAELAVFPDAAAEIARERADEAAVRLFLEDKGILTIPDWVGHYWNASLPAYLRPVAGLGVATDHTAPSRLGDAVSYIRDPSPEVGFFELSRAKDPRPLLIHEGVPGHYLQLVLSWRHENPLRRHYYDSGPNEGIGFYAEELMLQHGYMDDSPKTRETIYAFMRLRALRVEVDVKLALGDFTIAEAGEYLRTTVPMDSSTATQEAAFFAATPGQAITYQIGKIQILDFLAEVRRAQGDNFSLRAFHDYLWKNGNVPIALLKREYLN